MNYLFCLQLFVEMDNPRIYINYLTNYFRRYIIEIQKADPSSKIGILMGEAPAQENVDIQNVSKYVIPRTGMIRDYELDTRKVLREYFLYSHERAKEPDYMGYHAELVRKYVDFEPDIIISRDNAPFLEKAFPNAQVFYTEVGFISRKPFPQTMYFDTIGMNCGSYLSKYWTSVNSQISLDREDREQIGLLKSRTKELLSRNNPFKRIITSFRVKYKRLFLLPLQFSGFSNIDAEIGFESQLDALLYVMDHVPEDIGIIVTTHPDYNILTPGTINFLKKKYRNFLFDGSFLTISSSSQYLLSSVDGVINLSSTIGMQTLFWDIPNLSLAKFFGKFMSRPFEMGNFEPLTKEEIDNHDKALFWLFTRYILQPYQLYGGSKLYDFFKKNIKSSCSDGRHEYCQIERINNAVTEFVASLEDSVPENKAIGKEKKYYELFVEASKHHFRGEPISDRILKYGKPIVIYGKGSIGYLLELELRGSDIFLGYIDKNTINDYVFNGNELIIVSPVQEFDAIKKEIAKHTDALCISAEELIRKNEKKNVRAYSKIIVFGTGAVYRRNRDRLSELNVVAYLDNDEKKQGTLLEGIMIHSPQDIGSLDYDFIILMSDSWKEMRNQLEIMGVPYNSLVLYKDIDRLLYLLLDHDLQKNRYTVLHQKYSTDKRKKVLLLSDQMNYTGASIVLFYAAKILKKHNYLVVVISHHDDELRSDFEKEGIEVIYDPYIIACNSSLWRFADIFETVFINTLLLSNALYGLNDYKGRIIWWIHESDIRTKEWDDNEFVSHIPEKTKIYGVGHRVINTLNGYQSWKDKTVRNLLYGLPDKVTKGRLNENERVINVIIVGLIYSVKGQDLFVKAINKMPDIKSNVCFNIIGKVLVENYAEEIKREIGSNDNIVFSGAKDRSEMLDIYANADILVCSSRRDSMPVVVVEAMMNGLICIVSDCIGTVEYIEDGKNGFVFQSENVDELSEKLRYVIENIDNMDEVRKNARKTYEDFFSMETFEKNLLKVIEE